MAQSAALQQYFKQTQEVDSLLRFHTTLSGKSGPGKRPAEYEVLHKSAIVILTACWEAYVENLIRQSMEIIAEKLDDPSRLPEALRIKITNARSKHLAIDSKHEYYPWFFAGDGWRKILLQFSESQLTDLNTPNPKNVEALLSLLLGIENITQLWGRPGMTSKDAADALDEYLNDRHVIAHGAVSTKRFKKGYVTGYRGFLDITVIKTDRAILTQLKSLGV